MEVIISLDSHDEELAVLGSRDQNLRQIREALAVKILARHGDLKIEGEDFRVERAVRVLEGLRDSFRARRTITPDLVADLIESQRVVEDRDPSAIGLASASGSGAGSNAGNGELRLGSRSIRSRTPGQARYLRALQENELVICVGPAGTGKTYLAVAMAVAALRSGRIKKIVLVRPAVEAGEHLGFLPGDLEAKINPYLRPLFDALHDLLDYGQIRRYMGNDLIEIAPLAYMRGRTLNDAVIILDEGQNATIPQMKMFLTRMGLNAKIVVTGDPTQVDLPPATPSGLADAVHRLRNVSGIGIVSLDKGDIVRHPLVQAIVNAYEGPEPSPSPFPSLSLSPPPRGLNGDAGAASSAGVGSSEAATGPNLGSAPATPSAVD